MYTKLSAWLTGLTIVVLLLGGCATTEDVKKIVKDSNNRIVEASERDRELVVASIRESTIAAVAGDGAHLDPVSNASDDSGWRESVARIEDFIANHPEETRTINALRVREAVVLFNAGQANLARAVFAEVDRSQLGSARDRAIYDSREHLIWWYRLGDRMTNDDRDSALSAINGLAEVADELDGQSDIRRYLEETRVRIALRLAQTFINDADVRGVLNDPMKDYGDQFDKIEQRAIQIWHIEQELGAGATLRSLRWYDYVPVAFSDADEIIADFCETGNCERYTPDWIACIQAANPEQSCIDTLQSN